ncbi:MAG: hypothetical protein AAF628_04090 [Planctomycetota bacterium]
MRVLSLSLPLALVLVGSPLLAQGEAVATRPADGAQTVELSPAQAELLDLAFAAASTIPVDPHVKDRSRTQEEVVVACLELDQPDRALRYLKGIANWRKGAAYADVAFYLAQHDRLDEVPRLLDRARKVAETHAREPNAQEWRTDRIRAKITRTHLSLGELEAALAVGRGLEPSESATVEGAHVVYAEDVTLQEQMEQLDAMFATREFARIRAALATCIDLFGRHYDDPQDRKMVQDRVENVITTMPAALRLDALMQLAGTSLELGDRSRARHYLDSAHEIMPKLDWSVEYQVPVVARLASLGHRAGDEQAAAGTARALEMYEADKEKVGKVFRAGVLREVAETYATMGDASAALGVYWHAIEEGADNVNQRPRAMDLAATCASMARHNVAPDDELRERILEIKAGLTGS